MRKNLYRIILVTGYPVIDFILVASAILLSYLAYRHMEIGMQVHYDLTNLSLVAIGCSFITVLFMHGFGAYKKESGLLNVEEIKSVIIGVTVSFFLFVIVMMFVRYAPSRYVLVMSYVFTVLTLVTVKMTLYHILSSAPSGLGFHNKVLIYGAGDLGRALYRAITSSPKIQIVPVGFIDDNLDKQGQVFFQSGFRVDNGIRILGGMEDIPAIKRQYQIDEVYIAISNIDHERLARIMRYLKENQLQIAFVPNLYKVYMHQLRLYRIGDIPIIREEEHRASGYLPIKRLLDIGLAVTLLILFGPLMALLAWLVKHDSHGPAFFVQQRIGQGGIPFTIIKFRTMRSDAAPYAVAPAAPDEARITRLGRFLRRTSLDELPQILNVLKGEMSFVGPRPEMPFIVKQYNEIQRHRLKVLPGITGLWQLSGDRRHAIHENMDYDLYYIRNMSFFLDVVILIETMLFAFKGT